VIICSCGKVIDRIPLWLSGVNVEFVCTNCPQRQARNAASAAIASASVNAKSEKAVPETDTLEETED